jgi:hypothetical protein
VPLELQRMAKHLLFASTLSVSEVELLCRSRMKVAAARVQV